MAAMWVTLESEESKAQPATRIVAVYDLDDPELERLWWSVMEDGGPRHRWL